MLAQKDRSTIDKILVFLGTIVALVLLAVGALSLWASSFINNQVKSELTSQQIVFPAKGSPALDPTEFPTLQQYAGQTVDNATKAKAFANDFIGVHLSKVANGQTYSEVSNLANSDPSNQTLQKEKATLFQGETLRGLLLNAYAFGTVGTIARYIAFVSLVGGVVMIILVLMGLGHLKSTKKR